jgi:hypothetical protein
VDPFLKWDDNATLDIETFVKLSKEPESLGLSRELFLRFSLFQVHLLDLQFMDWKTILDVPQMERIRDQRNSIVSICSGLEKSMGASKSSFEEKSSSEWAAGKDIPAMRVMLRVELGELKTSISKHFNGLLDIHKGNFELARKCRDTLQTLQVKEELLDSNKEEDFNKLIALPVNLRDEKLSSSSEIPESNELKHESNANKEMKQTNEDLKGVHSESIQPATAVAVIDRESPKIARQILESQVTPVASSHQETSNDLAQQAVLYKNSRIVVTRLDWNEEYSGENATNQDIDWKCTVTSGLSTHSAKKISMLLHGGMSYVCAQLALDMQWSTLTNKETSYEHSMKIPSGHKLIVSQEVLEGYVEVDNSVFSLSGKKVKQYRFRLKKEKLKYETIKL